MTKTISGIIIIILLCIGSFLFGHFYHPKEIITIKKEIQYETVYKYKDALPYTPDNFKIYQDCYNSPLVINTGMNNNVMHIIAKDDCKSTSADVVLEGSGGFGWHTYAVIGLAGVAVGGYAVYRLLK